VLLMNDGRIGFRVPSDLLTVLREKAEREQRSLSSAARVVLSSALASEMRDVRVRPGGDAARFEGVR